MKRKSYLTRNDDLYPAAPNDGLSFERLCWNREDQRSIARYIIRSRCLIRMYSKYNVFKDLMCIWTNLLQTVDFYLKVYIL